MFLVLGTLVALFWANTQYESYEQFAHIIHFAVNDIAMGIFFGIAAKEIREAMLPGGSLNTPRAAALPLLATVGGVIGPVLLYFAGSFLFAPELSRGWAVPTATDIAFSYMVARFLFGPGHPAISFLLLLAVADDAIGLVILAVFYPTNAVNLEYFILFSGGAMLLSLFMWKVIRMKSFWWYLILPGALSWWGFYQGGIHPALALVPLMWCMPHEHSDEGFFTEIKGVKIDALNQFEKWWKNPTELILGFFGLVNAGVVLSSLGTGTLLVSVSLVIGKPLGIFALTLIGLKLGLRMPEGLTLKDIPILGAVAGIGCTVAIFVAGVAFQPGAIQDAAKIGALVTVLVAPFLAILLKKILIK